MIVGEHSRENDLTVNITKMKQQTNIRSANKDNTVTMKKPRIMTLEEALEYLNEDEFCELTPESIRLRKKILIKSEREREEKRKKIATK
jgi:GTP-binding protein